MVTAFEHDTIISREASVSGGEDVMSGPPVSSQRRRATYEIMCGNAREVVPELDVVHMVMTSPPYWAKRRYGSSSAEVGREEDVEAYIGSLVAILASVPLHPRGSM
jgi:hypothetical protein